MIMTLEELNTRIKSGKLNGIFFFYGEERYVLISKLNEIIKKTVPEGTEPFNLIKFEGKTSADDILTAVDRFPQLSETKAIIVENSGILNNATLNEFKSIKKAAEAFSSDTCLIFIENDFDKAKLKNLSFIENSGGVVKFEALPINQLELWITKYFEKNGKKISGRDALYIVNICGRFAGKIASSCEKLKFFTADRQEITRADIDSVVEKTAEYKIYEFADNVLKKNRAVVYEHLKQLKAAKETKNSPNYVLNRLTDKLSELLMCKLLSEDGLSIKEIMEYYDRRKPEFAVKNAVAESKRLDEVFLKTMIDKGLFYDYQFKCGRLSGWAAVDMFVAEIMA